MADNVRVKMDEFTPALSQLLIDYGDEIIDAAREIMQPVMKEGAERLKAASPKRTGKYRRNWKEQVDYVRFGANGLIYSKSPYYKLTHLLEHGHALRRGGRTYGQVKGIEHIGPVNEWVQDEYERRILARIATGTTPLLTG